MRPTVLVWFRHDLRLTDHPALTAALQVGQVIPFFIWSPEDEAPWAPGAASRWWLHHSLHALANDLKKCGARLILRQGRAVDVLPELVQATRAQALFWNRRYEPAALQNEDRVQKRLKKSGLRIETFNGSLLQEPWTIKTKAGKPFQVFTPFWRACMQALDPRQPLPKPHRIPGPRQWPSSVPLEQLGLLPRLNWASGFRSQWTPGEAGAHVQVERFLAAALARYPDDRNRPALVGSSRLSPHLHFGEISPQYVWHRVQANSLSSGKEGRMRGADIYSKEIGWREFAHHLLYHFPHTPEKPLRDAFRDFPWQKNNVALNRWKKGCTGYPLVDAGLREAWTTGWMHNRVRMIVGSFLVKDLLLPWQTGARWFWDTLVDADLANNTLGWQWVAGCGADASPFYRIFNPVLQGETFDPEGAYIRRWIPELKDVPAASIHKPWTLPNLPAGYPSPLVDHAAARTHALAALRQLRKKVRPHPVLPDAGLG